MNDTGGPWKLDGRLARLSVGSLIAQVDVLRPQLGLHEVRFAGVAAPHCRILQCTLGEAAEEDAPSEYYVRGNDLVAVYPQTPKRLGTCRLYWRVVDLSDAEGVGDSIAIDLQASVNTSLLDTACPLQIGSTIAGEVLRREGGAANFAPQVPLDDVVEILEPSTFLVRPRQATWSYAEAVHAEDFGRDRIGTATDEGAGNRLAHSLFSQPLEKGVILRARVRGAFVPRRDDESAATALYEHLLRAPLPLTT